MKVKILFHLIIREAMARQIEKVRGRKEIEEGGQRRKETR